MLKLLSFFSKASQLDAARTVLAHVAQTLDLRCSVRLWDGSLVALGQNVDANLSISIAGPGVIGSLLRCPTFDNLIRHYAKGAIEFHGGSLMQFGDLLRRRLSRERLKQVRKGLLIRSALPFLFARANGAQSAHAFAGDEMGRQSRLPDHNREYVQFHYDVGNDFYRLFLDPEMQYSCSYFTDWNNPLEQAQLDKLDMICRKLRLRPGERLLDIGCGWGGLLCHAARNYGVRAHGVTLSQEQLDFTKAKIARLNLDNRVTVELRDYAALDGEYDKIASIGMVEHVGLANYPKYFGKIFSLLRDRGILLNHGITRRAKQDRRRFRKTRPEHRFISKYIFPGSELDHIGHTCETMEKFRFEVHDVEDWREHYGLTCRFWCDRLYSRREQAIELVGAERYRLWAAYLAGVSHAFTDGTLRIYQVVASKHAAKGRAELPPTRADLYRT